MTENGWDGILEEGESLIWQGQPVSTPDWSSLNVKDMLFGAAFSGFALFWMASALGQIAGSSFMGLVFPLFGLPFLAVGLRKAGADVFWQAYRRRHTWYSMTNRRAFIATNIFGRKTLDAYPISAQTPLELDDSQPGHVLFATDFVKTKNGSKRRRIGFTHLTDSRAVYDKMRNLQREAL